MVGHANRQLRRMTDRYLLQRDRDQPLELNVIDSYQAGEVRSTKNLSGGESFLVSLALALGLSHMASRKVRVDSLFLDEGVRHPGRRGPGHRPGDAGRAAPGGQADRRDLARGRARERIAARIQVEPHTGGRSLLFGPGCARL